MADDALKEEEPIIVKKIIKKVSHGGSHGGAWKVAYADFVTAMMCLFLLLWLVNVDPSAKSAISQVFKQPSTSGPLSGNIFVFGGAKKPGESGRFDGGASFLEFQQLKLTEENKKEIKKTLEKELLKELDVESDNELKEKIEMHLVEEGILIELKDTEKQGFFSKGSATLTYEAKAIVDKLGNLLRSKLCYLIISGFTDGTSFEFGNYDNWNLSTDRAIAVKSRLTFSGVNKTRFSRVEGYADTQHKAPGIPLSPINRRITILLLQEGQKNKLLPTYLNNDDNLGKEVKLQRANEAEIKQKVLRNERKLKRSTGGKRRSPMTLDEIRRKKARETFRTRHPWGTGSNYVDSHTPHDEQEQVEGESEGGGDHGGGDHGGGH